jgi:hypothetical protein
MNLKETKFEEVDFLYPAQDKFEWQFVVNIIV